MSRLINLMKGVAMPLFDDYVDFDAEMENIGADTSPVLQTPPELRTHSSIERDREVRELERELLEGSSSGDELDRELVELERE